MLHLLKLEWLKQKDYVLFRILAIAYIILLPASLFVGKTIQVNGDAVGFNPAVQLFSFPTIWEWLGYIGNWMVFFVLGFMAVLMVTNEYANKTLRQNIIVGLNREDYFKSKLLFMVTIATIATIYYVVCALVIGFFHVNDTLYFSTVFKNADMIPRYWLMSMGYMSFGLLIGLLVKRTGIALFLYLAYIMMLEPIIRWVMMFFVIKNVSMSFMPLNAIEDLAPLPVASTFFGAIAQQGFRVILTPWEAGIATAIYTSLFLFFSYKRLKNSDL